MREDGAAKRMGGRVKELREAAGLNQRDFSGAIGLSRNYLGRVERGEQAPSANLLARVARVCNQDPWLLCIEAGYCPAEIQEIIVQRPVFADLVFVCKNLSDVQVRTLVERLT